MSYMVNKITKTKVVLKKTNISLHIQYTYTHLSSQTVFWKLPAVCIKQMQSSFWFWKNILCFGQRDPTYRTLDLFTKIPYFFVGVFIILVSILKKTEPTLPNVLRPLPYTQDFFWPKHPAYKTFGGEIFILCIN